MTQVRNKVFIGLWLESCYLEGDELLGGGGGGGGAELSKEL